MTEVKDAITTMYMVKSTEKINEQEKTIKEQDTVIKRLKRRCLYVVLLLVASIAFNLAFLFSYIGGNECENTESQHVMSQTKQSDPN